MGNGCTSIKAVHVSTANSHSRQTNLRIVVVGESLSGKTCLLKRYNNNSFKEDYIPTKSANIVSVVKKVNVPNQEIVAIDLWEVPAYKDPSLLRSCLKNADAAIVTMDLSDEDSYTFASKWRKFITQHSSTSISDVSVVGRVNSLDSIRSILPVLLLGTKFDVVKEAYLQECYSLTGTIKKQPIETTNKHLPELPRVNKELHMDGRPDNLLPTSGVEVASQHVDIQNNEDSNCVVEMTNLNFKNITVNGDIENVNHVNDSVADCVDIVAKTDAISGDQEIADSDTHGEENNVHDGDSNLLVGTSRDHDTDGVVEGGSSQAVQSEFAQSGDQALSKNNEHLSSVDEDRATVDIENANNLMRKSSEGSKQMLSTLDNKEEFHEDNVDKHVLNQNEVDMPTTILSVNGIEDVSSKDTEETNTMLLNGEGNEDLSDRKKSVQNGNHSEIKSNLKKLFPKDMMIVEGDDTTKESTFQSNASTYNNICAINHLPCIIELEKFAEEYDFIAGIPVSSKDSKGGVHEAIQSLIRFLLSRINDGTQRKRKSEEASKSHISLTKKAKQRLQEDFEPLQNVGIIEIDESLKLSNSSLEEAETLTSTFRGALHEFKRECFGKGLTAKKHSSFEECIAALKQSVESPQERKKEKSEIRLALLLQDKSNYSLVASEQEGFVSLRVVDDCHDYVDIEGNKSLPGDVVFLLDLYNNKVHTSCAQLLNKFEPVERQLSHHLLVVADKEEKAWDLAVAAGRSQYDVHRILTAIAQSKARMRGTLEQFRETNRFVAELQLKTKAVLLF